MDGRSKKIRNVVVATDLSEIADCAILRAIEIAKSANANLTILHVVEKKNFDNFLETIIPKELLQTPTEYATTLIQEKIYTLLRHKVQLNYAVISSGKPAVKILQYVRKNKVDLLVIGAHGKHSMRDLFVGTTAEYISERTTCPVLITKNTNEKPYKKILVPVDFSDVSKAALNYTIKLFPNSNIRLIHVGDHEFEHLLKEEDQKGEIKRNNLIKMRKAILFYLESKMKKFISRCKRKITKSSYNIVLGYPGPTIVKETMGKKCDLVVMGTQGHGMLHYHFIGSVAKWVMADSDKDILLIPPKKTK
jgi:nucleotide-binding universal stress UspA family protein